MKLCALPGNEALRQSLAGALGAATFALETRQFPDGESYVRIAGDCGGEVAIVCTLDHPDEKTVPLLALADALRAEGATRVGLIAPYLAYLRQDRQFKSGEAVSSRTFANMLSAHLDWLVTVDPHLHRYKSLSEIYSIKTQVCHAAPAIAAWIMANVPAPLLIGPDSESAQWVGDIAARIGAPGITLEKTRKGDREVEVSIPHLGKWQNHTPVLADDIVLKHEAVRRNRLVYQTDDFDQGAYFSRVVRQFLDFCQMPPGSGSPHILMKLAQGIRRRVEWPSLAGQDSCQGGVIDEHESAAASNRRA